MKELALTGGQTAMVDDEDYTKLAKWKWTATKRRNTFYAERDGIKMHRLVMAAPVGLMVDHINGNGLDNRKANLRLVTCRQNNQNRHNAKSSAHPGIYWHKTNRKWIAQIGVEGKTIHLGAFDAENDAALAYRNACSQLANGTTPKPKRSTKSSHHPGVYWHKASQKWLARHQVGNKRVYIGLFATQEEAAAAYIAAKGERQGCPNTQA